MHCGERLGIWEFFHHNRDCVRRMCNQKLNYSVVVVFFYQIRHATLVRLLDRLTDLRFLSIDFLNTFLLTYRVFTTGEVVLEALKKVYKNPEYGKLDSGLSLSSNLSSNSLQEPLHRYSGERYYVARLCQTVFMYYKK